MDYSCRDIPMRLDINHQPLNFDIYLSQVTDIPRTSTLEEEPYNFSIEIGALVIVDKIIKRITARRDISKQQLNQPADNTPLTPIKTSIHQHEQLASSSSNGCDGSDSASISKTSQQEETSKSQINPREFEDINYNPFDHLELQTIDELRELNLVFQATQNSVNPVHEKQTSPQAGP